MRYKAIQVTMSLVSIVLCAIPLPSATPASAAEQSVAEKLEAAYAAEIQPLIVRYCHECHGADETIEADLNLFSLTTWADASRQPETWQKVDEMLTGGLMPPEDADQPTPDERAKFEQWVHDYLALEAGTRAGDPGPVVLRRLSNAEYTYTLRDLTGVESLDPAREFPIDGAAGEGFTNTGNALVMSPALVTKYLDAAKEVASHAVLLPDGFRFSPHTTARDWTDTTLARIRDFYSEFSDAGGDSQVNVQGVGVVTNQGGRLPVEKYLAATLVERKALATGHKTIDAVAREHGLNAKYLDIFWSSLTGSRPSLLLDGLRARWRAAQPEDAAALAAYVAAWQKGLWSFSSVALIGREGGPKRWMESVNPLTTQQEIKFKVPESPDGQDVTISLFATDAGDGNEHDFVVWQSPRLVAPGRPDLLLRDVREVARELAIRRTRMFASAAAYLNVADEISAATGSIDVAALAKRHGVEEAGLRAWLDYLGISADVAVELEGHFTNKLIGVGGFEYVNGWGSSDTPSLAANSSDEHVRIPGNVKPHSVVVHPSPTLRAAVGWQSPISATVRIEAAVAGAHPGCGNGVTWALELRRGATRHRLASGTAPGEGEVKVGPFEHVTVRAGDAISLLIGPLDGNHTCDLTAIDLTVASESSDDQRTWHLAEDVSGDVLAANPHADRFGNAGVWHFYAEPDAGGAIGPVIAADSLVAKWQAAKSGEERRALAMELQKLLTSGPPEAKDSPDAVLYRQLAALSGPLFGGLRGSAFADNTATSEQGSAGASPSQTPEVGLDPAMFGRHPNGGAIGEQNLCVQAPSIVEIRLPADLAAGCELVTTAVLDEETGAEGSVQADVVAGKPALESGLRRSEAKVTVENGQWSSNNKKVANSAPILVTEGSAAQRRMQAAFEEFRQLFPAALCYTKIVPVDEVTSVILFYREDDHLVRLMLDESQRERLDRLWDELHYVSRDALALVDLIAQIMEFATQDADPKVFEPLR
ncbi:MAG: DUF1587 domain-containing protein, partial [Planctomycetes bacterium]|nr:DUF1587 domain-containing protein [Planctomycetota bacterium]